MKSSRMRWVDHVGPIGERRAAYGVWCGNLREGGHLEDPGIDGKIILNGSSRSGMGETHGLDSSDSE